MWKRYFDASPFGTQKDFAKFHHSMPFQDARKRKNSRRHQSRLSVGAEVYKTTAAVFRTSFLSRKKVLFQNLKFQNPQIGDFSFDCTLFPPKNVDKCNIFRPPK